MDVCHVVCGTGSVCLSVCLPVCPIQPPHAAPAGFLWQAQTGSTFLVLVLEKRPLNASSSSSMLADRQTSQYFASLTAVELNKLQSLQYRCVCV